MGAPLALSGLGELYTVCIIHLKVDIWGRDIKHKDTNNSWGVWLKAWLRKKPIEPDLVHTSEGRIHEY